MAFKAALFILFISFIAVSCKSSTQAKTDDSDLDSEVVDDTLDSSTNSDNDDDAGNTDTGEIKVLTEDTTTFVDHDLLIIISEEIHGESLAMASAIEEYQRDLDIEEITNALFLWQPGSAEVLRSIIKIHVDTCGTQGVLLLGEMPAAWFEQLDDYNDGIGPRYCQFPTDIYFADTNGIWEDTDNNGIYDVHPMIDVEIFISRIPGTAQQIQEYLAKVHTYKTSGSLTQTRSFYNFIDDDWNDYEGWNGKKWELESIYESRYIWHIDEATTTKEKYLEQMRGDGAEFVYQWIHTSPQDIHFDNDLFFNPENFLSIDEIRTPPVYASFYNLFNCSASRFTEDGGSLATAYLHSPNGLATFGSTKVGGSYQPKVFHSNLANGENWGTSWKLWINDTFGNDELTQSYLDLWWLGMVILGDPTLRLTDKITTPKALSLTQPQKLSKEQQDSLNKFFQNGYQNQYADSFERYKRRHPKFFRK